MENWYDKNYFERMWKFDMIKITSKECGKLIWYELIRKNVKNWYDKSYFERMWKIDDKNYFEICGKLIWCELLQKNVEELYTNYFERMWKIDMIWIVSK